MGLGALEPKAHGLSRKGMYVEGPQRQRVTVKSTLQDDRLASKSLVGPNISIDRCYLKIYLSVTVCLREQTLLQPAISR